MDLSAPILTEEARGEDEAVTGTLVGAMTVLPRAGAGVKNAERQPPLEGVRNS